jgi:hypothetical protein
MQVRRGLAVCGQLQRVVDQFPSFPCNVVVRFLPHIGHAPGEKDSGDAAQQEYRTDHDGFDGV